MSDDAAADERERGDAPAPGPGSDPRPAGPRLLVLDNYDSFTYNLVQHLGELGADVTVRFNDAVDLAGARELAPDGIVISPGPGSPDKARDFGVCGPVLEEVSPDVPTLGVCLGLQGFVHVYGGRVVRAPKVVHGKASRVRHDGTGLFEGLPDPLAAGRYHSLVVDPDLPDGLVRTAWTEAGEGGGEDAGSGGDAAGAGDAAEDAGPPVVMGVRHADLPIEGVQFHPESILTDHGKRLLSNFLERCR